MFVLPVVEAIERFHVGDFTGFDEHVQRSGGGREIRNSWHVGLLKHAATSPSNAFQGVHDLLLGGGTAWAGCVANSAGNGDQLPHLTNVTGELVFETHQLRGRVEKIPVTILPRNIAQRVADIGDQQLKLVLAFHLIAMP
jgi:hypothetical protein